MWQSIVTVISLLKTFLLKRKKIFTVTVKKTLLKASKKKERKKNILVAVIRQLLKALKKIKGIFIVKVLKASFFKKGKYFP